MHSFRFQVVTSPGAPAGDVLDPEAGFNTVSTPEQTVEVAEYKEGVYTYTRKYPGNPTMSDVTLTRGVTRADTNFYEWVQAAIRGSEYRTDMEIRHFHRDDFGDVESADRGAPTKVYVLDNALPIRNKIAADMDATASDISIQEMDVAYESFSVITGG
jgi:phage tail-like protein